MKYPFVVLGVLLFVASAWAQDELPKHCFTLQSNLKVYTEPKLESRVFSELQPGDRLTQGAFLGLEEIDGRYWRWYAVEFEQNGAVLKGYIWTPENFSNNQLQYQDTLFYYDTEYNAATGRGTATLYAKRGGSVVSETAEVVSTASAWDSVQKADYLTGVLFVLGLHVSNEACGYPDETHYFAWTGAKLVPLVSAISFLDEWAGVSYSDQIFWPGGDTPWNIIVKLSVAREMLEDENGDSVAGAVSYATQVYTWDGGECILQEQDTALSNWWQPGKYNW